MGWNDLMGLAGSILLSLGGGAVIVFSLSSWLGKVWAARLMEREKALHTQALESLRHDLAKHLEYQKVALRKSEILYTRQIDAASALVALNLRLIPEKSFPDDDWYEACESIALSFETIHKELQHFFSTYGAVLHGVVRQRISNALSILHDKKIEIEMLQVEDVPVHLNKSANQVFNDLRVAERALIEDLSHQATA